jgi:hypothetical protein
LALALVLIASTASTAFAQIIIPSTPPSNPTPDDGNPGNGSPNPTGGTGNLVAIHLR